MLGAYGTAMRTQFNGFGVTDTALVEDEPMATSMRQRRSGSARTW